MSQDAALPAEQIHLLARAPGHLLEHGRRVRIRPGAKLDLVGGELRALGSNEPHVVKLLVAGILTNGVKGLADVHVDIRRHEAFAGAVHNFIATQWTFVVLVDVTSIEV